MKTAKAGRARRARSSTLGDKAADASVGSPAYNVDVFRTALGWVAIYGHGDRLARLTFGHPDPQCALAALKLPIGPENFASWRSPLVHRLTRYADGQFDDFLDVGLEPTVTTPFQQRVVDACRRIPLGETRTYGELAQQAGRPGAARAVGNVMARNPIPLIVPCHRVVGAAGGLGGYSGVEGLVTKRRLLAMEAAARLSCRA